MERLTQLNAQLAASITWIEEARRTLQKAADLAASLAEDEEEETGAAGAAGAAGGSASGMEVDGEGAGDEASGAPSGRASAGPSQGTTPEPDHLAAALLAAAAAGTESGVSGARGGGATPPLPLLHPLPPFAKPKRRGRQPKSKGNEHASGLPELKVR